MRSNLRCITEWRWSVEAALERVSPLVLDVAARLEREGVAGRALFGAQLVVEELVSNVVRHGYRGDARQHVDVSLRMDEDRLELEIVDRAPAYDPLTKSPLPDTTSTLERRALGGLGVHLAKRYTDELRYERKDGQNRLFARLAAC
jgi:anti-sigma regulatory factor (Ser/Thr protein kinase)